MSFEDEDSGFQRVSQRFRPFGGAPEELGLHSGQLQLDYRGRFRHYPIYGQVKHSKHSLQAFQPKLPQAANDRLSANHAP